MHAWRHSEDILKHGYTGDPSRACLNASVDVTCMNAAQGEDGNSDCSGGLAKSIQSKRFAIDQFGRRGEDRSEHGEVGALVCSLYHFVDRVARNANQEASGYNLPNFRRRARMRRQMNAVGGGGERDIGAFVHQHLRPARPGGGDYPASQGQKFATWQILLPDLDALDSLMDCAINGLQQIVDAAELFPVCDVIPQRHYSSS